MQRAAYLHGSVEVGGAWRLSDWGKNSCEQLEHLVQLLRCIGVFLREPRKEVLSHVEMWLWFKGW